MKANNTPILYIIGGANGSGKTTFAKDYVKKYNIPFINADEIAKTLNPDNLEEVRIQAGKQFLSELDVHLNQYETVAIESTLSGKTLVKKIIKAKSLGYQIHLIYLFLEMPQTNVYRVQERVAQGGHDVPEKDIRRRYDRSRENFWNLYRNHCTQWTIKDNSTLTPKDIAHGTDTHTNIQDDFLFTIFSRGLIT